VCLFCSGGDEFRFPNHVICDQKEKTGQLYFVKIQRQLQFQLNSYILVNKIKKIRVLLFPMWLLHHEMVYSSRKRQNLLQPKRMSSRRSYFRPQTNPFFSRRELRVNGSRMLLTDNKSILRVALTPEGRKFTL